MCLHQNCVLIPINMIKCGTNFVHFLYRKMIAVHVIQHISLYQAPTYCMLSGQRRYGVRSLPNTTVHGQQCESNLRPFNLESNTHPLGYNNQLYVRVHSTLVEQMGIGLRPTSVDHHDIASSCSP